MKRRKDLIADHGPYFCEPINRLAKLYSKQGKHSDADALCRIVLHVKPWHIGALCGIVNGALEREDLEMALYWDARRMPTLSNNNNNNTATHRRHRPTRAAWVDLAVEQAQQALQRAEERTTRFLGKPEEYYKRKNNSASASASTVAQDDGNDWQ